MHSITIQKRALTELVGDVLPKETRGAENGNRLVVDRASAARPVLPDLFPVAPSALEERLDHPLMWPQQRGHDDAPLQPPPALRLAQSSMQGLTCPSARVSSSAVNGGEEDIVQTRSKKSGEFTRKMLFADWPTLDTACRSRTAPDAQPAVQSAVLCALLVHTKEQGLGLCRLRER